MAIDIKEKATQRSLRGELEEFVETTLALQQSISVERLVRMAQQHFNGDEWVREALIREGLNALIPSIAADVRHQIRRRARRSSDPEETRDRIASVFEHVGYGFQKGILTMRRPDHVYAANERKVAAAGHLRWAGFHDAVAALHTDDVTPTGDLPAEQIAALWKEHIEAD